MDSQRNPSEAARRVRELESQQQLTPQQLRQLISDARILENELERRAVERRAAGSAPDCIICRGQFTLPRATAQPCGHVFCFSCVKRYTHCPRCRGTITKFSIAPTDLSNARL